MFCKLLPIFFIYTYSIVFLSLRLHILFTICCDISFMFYISHSNLKAYLKRISHKESFSMTSVSPIYKDPKDILKYQMTLNKTFDVHSQTRETSKQFTSTLNALLLAPRFYYLNISYYKNNN